MRDLDTLEHEVRAAIEAGGPDPARFDSLCIEIAEAQGRRVQGRPGLDSVVPVPEAAFKTTTVACFDPDEAQAEFLTSGTTTGSPGRHLVRDLSMYRRSAMRGFERFVLYPPAPARVITLIPPAEARPTSSLSHMVSFVLAAAWPEPPVVARAGDAIALDPVLVALREATARSTPVVLLGTSLDFLALIEALSDSAGARFRLPAGSRAMHTGGEKASGRELARDALWSALRDLLGIPEEDVVEEFGMTELTSQAYDSPRVTPGPRRFVPVPWMRTRVLDPATMADVPEGQSGLLCHYDLANVHTAVAVLSGDLAARVRDGFFGVHRAPGATARGCSSEAAVRWRTSRDRKRSRRP